MATADELLSTLDTDKTLIIDKDLRTIIIPSSVKNLGVESDDDVLRLKFSMPRMYGDVDLSDFSIYINYMNAKNTGDVYVVDDKTIADDTITFSWLVGRVALAYKGNVRFIVCMKKHDGDSNVIQEYNTTIASLPVLEGLETGETVIQQNPDIIEMLLTSLEPLIGTTQTVTPAQVLAAIKAGRDIALQYTDSYYGTFVFSAFNVNEKLGIVVSNSILPQMDGLTGTLLGFVEDAGWIFKATKTATKDDVGTAVNEALTAAKASGEFDGADGKSAYSYAQDGGYSGTEAEFAAKLAAESIDKALFVVNITTTDEVTYSADKTFDEIVRAYNEGKYSIVAVWDGLIMPLSEITESVEAIFGCTSGNDSFLITITYDNKVREEGMLLATIHEKLPNPYPLTFTGAVSGSYDGSSAKTIEIPSGGGGGSGMNLSLVYENTFESVASINETIEALNGKENFVFNIEFTIPSDSTTAATITNANLYNGEFDFPIAYYVGYGNYSTSYPKKAAYGSFLKLGEGLWERIRLKAVSVEMFCDPNNLVAGNNIAFQYLKDNQNSHAAGLYIGFNQTMESVKIQIYAG